MLETLDYTIRIGSTPTFLYFDLYLYSAYAAHYVYSSKKKYIYISFANFKRKMPEWFLQYGRRYLQFANNKCTIQFLLVISAYRNRTH